MKTQYIVSLLAAVSFLAVHEVNAGTSIAVQFQGRDGSPDQPGTDPGCPPLNTTDTAGVVPQQNWNPIDDAYSFTPANNGTTFGLVDSTAALTTVTLTFAADDSWYNDVTPTNLTTPNARMMNGIMKASASGGTPEVLIFSNLVEGQYDLYVYTDMNGSGTEAAVSDWDFLTTYYVTEQHQFYDTNTFVQGTNTDPNSTAVTNVCNYVKFSNLGTYGRGAIGAVASWVKGNDGIGISGIQIVNIGPPLANTAPVSITRQPFNRRVLVGDTNVVLSIATRGPVFSYQWYKNTTLINGATASSYQLPAIASGDNGAIFYVIAANNVNSIQSSNAVITVGNQILLPEIAENLWFGGTVASVEAGTYDTTPPGIHRNLSSFHWPSADGVNYAERLNGIFVAPQSGNYTFFVDSDDDSDLFLSTDATAANKRLIAQEVDWAADLNWTGNDGGTAAREIPQKRSDQWSPDGGTTVPFASGIALTAGSQYYIEAVHHQGGGGADIGATYKLVGQPDPAVGSQSRINVPVLAPFVPSLDGGFIVITNQPQNVSRPQGFTATFNVAATTGYIGDSSGAAPPIYWYQWQEAPQGSSTFTNIPGANSASYISPVLDLTNNGAQFKVTLLAADVSSNSAIAVLTVVNDTNPPAVVGAGALVGATQAGITFSKAVDPVTGGNPSSYKVNGVAPTAVSVLANHPPGEYLVQLTLATPVNANFTLNVAGVKDLYGNVLSNTNVTGTVINMTESYIGSSAADPGGPDPDPAALPAIVNVLGSGSLDVLVNGNDYWNNADGMNFIWEPKTNSFDVSVRVAYVQGIDNWTAGAIEVREGPVTTNGGGWELARHYFCKVDYGGQEGAAQDGSGAGANAYEFNCRRAPGDPTLRETSNNGPGASQGWGGTAGPGGGVPAYPNAWIRIARVRNADGSSDHLQGYSGTNGVNWALAQDVDLNDTNHAGFVTSGTTNAGPLQSVVYVGMGSVSHTGIGNGNDTNSATGMPWEAWISYRSFGDTSLVSSGPTLNFTPNPDGTVTLTYSGHLYSSTTVNGTYSLVSGASSPWPVNPKTSGQASVFYKAGP